MRNGIYRAWLNGPSGVSSGAVVFKDGDIFAVDRLFAFNGRYSERAERLTAEVSCKRLYPDLKPLNLPDRDELHLELEGAVGGEYAQVTGTIAEAPGFAVSFEFAFLCEA